MKIFTRLPLRKEQGKIEAMDNLLPYLKESATVRRIKKGGNVLFQGEIPRSVMIVRDGVVRAYTITSSGEERIVALYSKDEIVPLAWALDQAPNALFYYDALSEVRVLTVPKQVFLDAVMNNQDILRSMIRFVTDEYTALLFRITGLGQSRAIEKIGYTLYYLLFRYGVEKPGGTFAIDIKMSQTVIAALVGLTRESTTKNLKILKDKGIIDYTNSTYTVNKARLEGFLGEDAFRDLTL